MPRSRNFFIYPILKSKFLLPMQIFWRTLLPMLIWVIPSGTLLAQSILKQAIALRPHVVESSPGRYKFNSDENEQWMKKLATYLEIEGTVNAAQLVDTLGDNPFLGREGQAKVVVPNEEEFSVSMIRGGGLAKNVGGPRGVFSVNTIAGGLAEFIVGRAKEELTATFFADFQQKIQNNAALNTLFPNTARTLASIGKDIYQVNNYLNTLRADFRKDLAVSPTSLKNLLEDRQVFKKPERQMVAEDLLDFTQAMISRKAPDTLLYWLATGAAIQQRDRLAGFNDTLRQRLENLGAVFQVVNLLSESLRANHPDSIWMDLRAADRALRDEVTLSLYLGLLWQHEQSKTIRFHTALTTARSFREVMGGSGQSGAWRTLLHDFLRYGRQITTAQREHKILEDKIADPELTPYQPFHEFSSGLLGLLKTGARLQVEFAGMTGRDTTETQRFLRAMSSLNDLNYDARQGLYAAALNDIIIVLDNLLDKDEFQFRKPLVKYGRFIAGLAEADDAEAAAAIIEQIAEPRGGARVKKLSRFSVSLGAYAGGAAGLEYVSVPNTPTRRAPVLGLTAPVGLALNWGTSKRNSFSLFAPLVDVGALVAYRLDDGNLNGLPELAWRNILSPGLYAVWGFKGPFAVGLGAQRGPDLRKVASTNLDLRSERAWRVGAFIAVDIPIIHFFVSNNEPGGKRGRRR